MKILTDTFTQFKEYAWDHKPSLKSAKELSAIVILAGASFYLLGECFKFKAVQDARKLNKTCDQINELMNQTDFCPPKFFDMYVMNSPLGGDAQSAFLACWASEKLNVVKTSLTSFQSNNCECDKTALAKVISAMSYLNGEIYKRPGVGGRHSRGERFLRDMYSSPDMLSKLGCTLKPNVTKVCKKVFEGAFLSKQECEDQIAGFSVPKYLNATFWER